MKASTIFVVFSLFFTACGGNSSGEAPAKSVEKNASDEDYFIIRYTLDGEEYEKKVAKKTDRVKAVYMNSANDNPAPAVYLQFPVFTDSFILNVQADKPGTSKIPYVDGHQLDLSFKYGFAKDGKGIVHDFKAEDVTVTIKSIELKADPTAKTSIGMSMDGYANLKGSFQGLFTLTVAGSTEPKTVEKVQVSGEFFSGRNF